MDELPMGWQEVPIVGVKSDSGTPEDEIETTAHPELPRKEVKRWKRGDRIVRLCVEYKDKVPGNYAVHYGDIRKSEDEKWYFDIEDSEEAETKARILMRIGGKP